MGTPITTKVFSGKNPTLIAPKPDNATAMLTTLVLNSLCMKKVLARTSRSKMTAEGLKIAAEGSPHTAKSLTLFGDTVTWVNCFCDNQKNRELGTADEKQSSSRYPVYHSKKP